MRSLKLLFGFCLPAMLAGACAAPIDGGSDDAQTERGPLGKADHSGSCALPNGSDLCGGKSSGSCWCDDSCANYGDCCSDYEATCEEEDSGCSSNAECAANQFCDFDAGCGGDGECAPRPQVCAQVFAPVCGCDGQTYSNSCSARGAGVNVASQGACNPAPPPPPPPPPAASCEGQCGGKSAGTCWCDDQCSSYGDCCADFGDACGGDSALPDNCEDLLEAFEAETSEIRSCTSNAQCGQVLTGTSCGCTRNWVARTNADTTQWEALRDHAGELSCELPGTISTCDCPAVNGFRCYENVCTWNYQ